MKAAQEFDFSMSHRARPKALKRKEPNAFYANRICLTESNDKIICRIAKTPKKRPNLVR